MAALPSVVVGFIAGLWLASRVEREVVPVLLMRRPAPAFGTAGILFWDRLPRGVRRSASGRGWRSPSSCRSWLLGRLCRLRRSGPRSRACSSSGDFKLWLKSALDLVYDQRNCLVVGMAMGFAVIPIIFTIAEDAFSSVPPHLTAASLALGASRWQTAVRVVLPTASPGIFSAVMIGFGRAVGETMIVLMATGQHAGPGLVGLQRHAHPLRQHRGRDPRGALRRAPSTASCSWPGCVLFLMTFLVNTIAELIRQRLRERYRAI